jgi:hypothetical protein
MSSAFVNAIPKDCAKNVSSIFQDIQPRNTPIVKVDKNICIDARLFKKAAIGDGVQWEINPIERTDDGSTITLMITPRTEGISTSLILFGKDGKSYDALLVN